MAFWLFKSEPSTWSWQDQIAKGAAGEVWDGVRNYQARNFMRQMQIGDRGFFYHSQEEKSIIGLVEVIHAAQQDPTTDDPKWQCVTIKALQGLPMRFHCIRLKRFRRWLIWCLCAIQGYRCSPCALKSGELFLKYLV